MAEDAKVLGNRRAGHGEPAPEVARTLRPTADVVEETAARGIGEGGEGSVEGGRLNGARSHGGYVTYRLRYRKPPRRPDSLDVLVGPSDDRDEVLPEVRR